MTKNNIKFIIGGHGYGKSDWIDNRFLAMSRNEKGKIDLNKKMYLVVPEQDTNDRQRNILKKSLESHGMLNIDVVSFDRIAHTIFEELLIEPDKEKVIEDDIKTMLLTLILSKLKSEDKIKYYKKMVGKVGFSRKLTETMSELYSYNITDEMLTSVINNIDKANVKSKISDLKEIYIEFQNKLKEKGFFIKEDKYNLLAKYIDKSHLFDKAIVAFDGFTGFTPVQLDIFNKIAKVADEIYVSVDLRSDAYKYVDAILDKSHSLIATKNFYNEFNNKSELSKLYDKTNVFNLSLTYIIDIISSQMVYGAEFSKDNIIYLNENKKYSETEKKDLYLLEKCLYNYEMEGASFKPENISVFASKNIDDEIENTAQNIVKSVRKNEYSYNDIRIIVPSIDEYADKIKRKFKYYGIPLFIDDSKSILNSPYIEAIRAAIDVVDYSFTYDSVIRFLHSGIENQTKELYEFENFIRKYGIIGYNRYKDGFEKIKSCTESIFEGKKIYLSALLNFYKNCKEKKSIANYVSALYKFMQEYNLDVKFASFIDSFENKTKFVDTEKQELNILNYSKEVVEKTLSNLEIINENIEDREISIDEFKRLFDVGITEKNVKTIPFSLDQVVVGDLMRSRFDNPKVLYFLGLNQNKIPAKSSDLTIIDDRMRSIFEKSGIRLSQTVEETALNQRFYIYLALTNPTDKLILSYPRLNSDGESDNKSQVITDIENIFLELNPDTNEVETLLKEEKVDRDNFEFYNKNLLIDYVTDNFYNLKLSSSAKKGIIEKDPNEHNEYITLKNKSVEKALVYLKDDYKNKLTNEKIDYKMLTSYILNQTYVMDDKNIDEKLIDKLINNNDGVFVSSATAIEGFNNCNYKYFLERTLRIRDNENFRIDSNEIGSYIHSAFEYLFKDNHFDFGNDSTDYIDEKISEAMSFADSVVDNEKFYVFGKNDIGKYYGASKLHFIKERAKDIIKVSMGVFKDFADGTKFNNAETESKMYFEYKTDKNVPYRLVGKIDKIDTYEVGDNVYVRITDYKSTKNKKTFKLDEVKDGVSIQLVVYLDYILKDKYVGKKKVKTCGSYYFWTSAPTVEIKYGNIKNIDNIENDKDLAFIGITNKDDENINVLSENLEYKNKEKKDTLLTKKGHQILGEYLDDGQIDSLIKDVENKVASSIDEIKSGTIKIKPYSDDVCRYCNFANVCKYNKYKKQDEETE